MQKMGLTFLIMQKNQNLSRNQVIEDLSQLKSELVISKIKANQKCQNSQIILIFKIFEAFINNKKGYYLQKEQLQKTKQEYNLLKIKMSRRFYYQYLSLTRKQQIEVFQDNKELSNSALTKESWRNFYCYLDQNDNIRTGQDSFTKCISILSILSQQEAYRPIPIPQLPEEVKELQKQMAFNKAISFDGIPHSLILKDIWNEGTFQINLKFGWARLPPLNKAHPAIPRIEQFHPLIILSPLSEFLNFDSNKSCNQFEKMQFQKQQTGVINGLGTQVNIYLVNKWMKEYKGKDMEYLIFMDFSSAYNKISREMIYKNLEEKKILTQQEVKLLQAIHSRIPYINTYEIKFKVYFRHGVHRFLHPYLKYTWMNFQRGYVERLILKSTFQDMQITLFFIQIKHSVKWNLKVNKRKCGILPINHNIQKDNIINYPVINNYRNL
ncbi:unnamed protein product [Paramecium pentaurelia]|uniref:Reverse transcriptase domain-containing protein n=1 Tax=Paramecium pentaurelia TaxID=43138 RepID=A0A8S1WAQ9_9CILI|nr:unnamed protein product [Paramecium pentaurelia]